jgi:hypothetical protein
MTDLITCTKCGTARDSSWFSRDYRRRSFRTPWCKPCLRAADRLRRIGLEPDAYDALWKRQHGGCGICRVPFGDDAPARIDRTDGGVVRGLLCPRCKVGVATFREDVDRFRVAVAYLTSQDDSPINQPSSG